jgi:hypothetical protein
MDANDLVEIEAIKKLKARYFRLMDLQQWAEWKKCFTADITAEYEGPPRRSKSDDPSVVTCSTPDGLAKAVSGLFEGAKSIHQGYMPEIELTSPTTATGIWAMYDQARLPRGTFQGWGHYYEDYVKQNGEWRIRKIRLTRLHVEEVWQGI